jgi:hypothetical protein
MIFFIQILFMLPTMAFKTVQLNSIMYVCVELTWLMNVQDPPMVLIWPQDVQRDHMGRMFRTFTKTGSILSYEVWPAVMLTKEGPLMVKGVSQYVFTY